MTHRREAKNHAAAMARLSEGKRPRWDSNPRITDLQSVPLVHLGTRPRGSRIIGGAGPGTRPGARCLVLAPRCSRVIALEPRRATGRSCPRIEWRTRPDGPACPPPVERPG